MATQAWPWHPNNVRFCLLPSADCLLPHCEVVNAILGYSAFIAAW